jgi:PAS domain S-box-containing protein
MLQSMHKSSNSFSMAEGQEPAASEMLSRAKRSPDDAVSGGRRARVLNDDVIEYINATPSAACVFDRATKACLAANDAAVRLLGGTRDDALALTLDAVCESDAVHAGASLPGLMRHAGTTQRVRGSGDTVVFDAMAQDVAGDRVLVLLVERPLPARTQALLREREQLFSALVEHAPDIIARIDRELRHVYVNPAVVSATGVAAHEITSGRHPQPGVPLELCVRWAAGVRRVFASGLPHHFELSFTAAGAEKHYESRMVPELGLDGRIESVLAIARDVTDRKRAELVASDAKADARTSRRALELLADVLPHPVRIYDRALRHVFANSANAALSAAPAADVAGLTNAEARYAPELAAMWDSELRRVFDSALAVASRFECGSGSERAAYDTHVLPLLDDSGAVEAVLWIAFGAAHKDAAANEEAYAAARQRNAFVREVHHRVKNNLQGVVGLLRQLANREDALQSALGKAIVQLQAIAVIHGLQGQELREDVPLVGMIEEIATSVERATGATVEYDSAAHDPDRAVCVREREAVTIALVLNELMMNAVKHRRKGGHVSVSTLVHAKRAVIEVSNDGTLDAGFDYARDAGLGTGLELVKALLPGDGVSLAYNQRGGCVKATLEIAAPVLAAETESPGIRDDWDRRKRPHSDRRR